MAYPRVDLTNCDKEPIHILGKVQSHGFLVAADKTSLLIQYASDNLPDFIDEPVEKALNQSLLIVLTHVVSADAATSLLELIRFSVHTNFDTINPVPVIVKQRPFHLIIHVSASHVVLEFEPDISASLSLQNQRIGNSLSRMLEGNSTQHMLQIAARQVKDLIQYDRVMIYKFSEDGHGEVVAEQRNDNLEPFLGLHYPASDIPRQARELYKINLTRIISDVDSIPSDIISRSAAPLDLTHAGLRAVSSIHIEYLQNMGVKASFSVSLIYKGELWGLIACHNYSPRFIDFKARQHAQLLGQVLSSSIEYRLEKEDREINLSFRSAAASIIQRMQKDWNLVDAFANQKEKLLGITNASSAALIFEGKTYLMGETPNEEQVRDLINWLQTHGKPSIYHTNNLSLVYVPAQKYKEKASGLLACAISKELGEYILFFKPEIITTVNWAGNPNKPMETDLSGNTFLSPRRSFEIWAQEVKGSSEKWSKTELNSVIKFREDILHFINLKSNEIRKLNEKLKEAYDELDTFSFTISHDLKTPLASVKNYTEILMEDGHGLDDKGKEFLRRIIKSADRMNVLIHEVLGYSRISRQQINYKNIEMAPLLEEIKVELIAAYKPSNLQLSIEGTPPIKGDRVMITQVFSNLLSNAIKYSSKSNPSIVKVKGKEEEGQVLYSIYDNGVGIDMNYGGHIFELFKRMDNAKEYEGSGVGLAIVKRIMEKHNARLWYESEPGNGTIFYLLFQKN